MKSLPVWAHNLRKARLSKQLKQTQLSAMLYKSSTVYGLYERGKVEPSAQTWVMLCDILHIHDLRKFLCEEIS